MSRRSYTPEERAAKAKARWSAPSPYGTYTGPRGTTEEWKRAFAEAGTARGAVAILQDDSPWGILGLAPGVDHATAKAVYKKLVFANHPDRGGDPEICRKIIAAWTVVEVELLGGKKRKKRR